MESTNPIDCVTGQIELTNDLCNIVNSLVEIIDTVYPNIVQNYTNLNRLFERAILAIKNVILSNLDSARLCNKTRMKVKQVSYNVIEGKIMSGKEKGKT
ncbi:hypothetical protein J437_LFUL011632, partial [Ladona fulva]